MEGIKSLQGSHLGRGRRSISCKPRVSEDQITLFKGRQVRDFPADCLSFLAKVGRQAGMKRLWKTVGILRKLVEVWSGQRGREYTRVPSLPGSTESSEVGAHLLVHLYHPVVWNSAVVLSGLGTVKNKTDGGATQNCEYESGRRQIIDFQMPANGDMKEK